MLPRRTFAGRADAVIRMGTARWTAIGRQAALFAYAPLGCAAHTESEPPPQVAPARWAKSSQSALPQAMQSYVPPGAPGLASQACPFQGAAVPVCQRFDTETATVDKVGRTLRVR